MFVVSSLPKILIVLSVLVSAVVGAPPVSGAGAVDFSRDVLPILSDRCFHCHGPDPDHREADLRLDLQESALATVVVGKPGESELFDRITSDDDDLRMPPVDSHVKPLSEEEIETLQRWIAEGASWSGHWAFVKPTRPDVPENDVPENAAHPIDAFVQKRLPSAGLKSSQRAPRHTLLRRLSFDLTGLPPTQKQLEEFLADDSEAAYLRAVNRLLNSPHHGERMAMWWLDAARYADTDGYQGDRTRTNWAWRDWVIDAFSGNMPFDQFTTEQFAGDLLPDATDDQILATCFHRNHMTNGEGGRDPEESRVDYVIDRVNTTGSVFLGLTIGCAQCHSHKFDPISQHDYYSLSAFFNSIDEDGKAGDGAKPYFKYQSPYASRTVNEMQRVVDRRTKMEADARRDAEIHFDAWLAQRIAQCDEGFLPWHPLQPIDLSAAEGTQLTCDDDAVIQASGENPRQDDYRLTAQPNLSRVTGVRLEVFPHGSHTDGKLSRGASGEFILTNFKVQLRRPGSSQLIDLDFESAKADVETGAKGRNYGNIKDTLDDDPRNGWTTKDHDATAPHVGLFALAEPLELSEGDQLIVVLLQRSTVGDANIGRFRLSVTDQPGNAVRSLDTMPMQQLAEANVKQPKEIDKKLRQQLLDQYLYDHAAYQMANESLQNAKKQLGEVKKASGQLNVMVLDERKEPRKTFVLNRGVWDQKGDKVDRGMPAAILDWPAESSQTRLDLARWLTSPDNPLTARVVVNHLWQQMMGAGLVRTADDFGLQGQQPTHPDLLDWLAVELVENGWDLRHVIRLIVTSETYQQSSHVSADLLDVDPENRLLARANRYRLPSWMIRDAALRASGLLNGAIGGPPIRPYQPDGIWAEIFMGRFRYEPSEGPAQYRRTVYAFWRRASAPTFLFDSAQRRVCEVRPRRTNTPLHALTLMNDKTQLVAAAELGRIATSQATTSDERLQLLYERVLSRHPSVGESEIVAARWQSALEHYQGHPHEADELIASGNGELDASRSIDRAEWASAMVTASMLLNLDEAITRE